MNGLPTRNPDYAISDSLTFLRKKAKYLGYLAFLPHHSLLQWLGQ